MSELCAIFGLCVCLAWFAVVITPNPSSSSSEPEHPTRQQFTLLAERLSVITSDVSAMIPSSEFTLGRANCQQYHCKQSTSPHGLHCAYKSSGLAHVVYGSTGKGMALANASGMNYDRLSHLVDCLMLEFSEPL